MDALKHFLEVEIEISKQRLESYRPEFFNGVFVGHKNAVKLFKLHIVFCQNMLRMIEKERECESE